MSEHPAHTSAHDHHITPPTALIKNAVILTILMGLTIAAYEFDFGHWITRSHDGAWGTFINNVIALLIATAKAYFVVSIFMGVKWGTKLIKMWALAGFVWLPLLLGIMGDYASRSWEPVQTWGKKTEISGRLPDEAAYPSELETNKPAPPPEEGEGHAE